MYIIFIPHNFNIAYSSCSRLLGFSWCGQSSCRSGGRHQLSEQRHVMDTTTCSCVPGTWKGISCLCIFFTLYHVIMVNLPWCGHDCGGGGEHKVFFMEHLNGSFYVFHIIFFFFKFSVGGGAAQPFYGKDTDKFHNNSKWDNLFFLPPPPTPPILSLWGVPQGSILGPLIKRLENVFFTFSGHNVSAGE